MVERIIRVAAAIFLGAVVLSCDKKEPCPRALYTLAYPYDACESRLCKGYDNPGTVTLKSSSGLTETMAVRGEKLKRDLDEDANCGAQGDDIRLQYESSLYANQFQVAIYQDVDTTRLTIQDGHSIFELNMKDTSGSTYWMYTGKRDAAGMEILPSLQVGSLSYSPVYKISSPIAVKKGEPNDITTYYYHAQYGIIRFDQKDSTKWEMEW